MMSAVNVLTKLEQNDKWLNENYDKLKADYNNQWVAILNKAVIAHNPDLKQLVKELKNSIQIVTTKSPLNTLPLKS
jgi:phage FluMu gp28-like protein